MVLLISDQRPNASQGRDFSQLELFFLLAVFQVSLRHTPSSVLEHQFQATHENDGFCTIWSNVSYMGHRVDCSAELLGSLGPLLG
jgi:hypothetical protein